jgi:CheY-like chemotaxis protein
VSQATIIVIEDNPDYQQLIVMAIQSIMPDAGVIYFRDGLNALSFLTQNDTLAHLPDVIVSDLRMPLVDGAETTTAVKSHPVLKTVPVIILSTSDNEKDKTRLLKSGASEYYTKPHTFNGLKTIIREIKEKWITGSSVIK